MNAAAKETDPMHTTNALLAPPDTKLHHAVKEMCCPFGFALADRGHFIHAVVPSPFWSRFEKDYEPIPPATVRVKFGGYSDEPRPHLIPNTGAARRLCLWAFINAQWWDTDLGYPGALLIPDYEECIAFRFRFLPQDHITDLICRQLNMYADQMA